MVETTQTKTATKTDENQASESMVIVELGAWRKKDITRLRKGRGDLYDEVRQAVEELTVAGKIRRTTEPVVIVVRKRDDEDDDLLSWLKW